MKVLLLSFLLLFYFSSQSQEITVNEVDKFTKQRRIQTSTTLAKFGLGCTLGFYYRSVDSTLFINVTGNSCAVGVVGTDDPFIFLLDNDSTVTAYSKGIQSYDVSFSGSTGSSKSYTHEYYIKKSDIEKLAAHKLVSVRAYINQGYTDVEVNKKRQDNLMQISQLFLKELNK